MKTKVQVQLDGEHAQMYDSLRSKKAFLTYALEYFYNSPSKDILFDTKTAETNGGTIDQTDGSLPKKAVNIEKPKQSEQKKEVSW